jgi:hypothetical protein
MGNVYTHNHGTEPKVVQVYKPFFNNSLANGPLRQFISYPQSSAPTARIGQFDGYEWGYNTDGSQYGIVRFNGVAVPNQAETFAMLQSKYSIGVNQNINTNPIFYSVYAKTDLEDPIESVVCEYNASNHKVFSYSNGTRTWSATIDGITYGWRSYSNIEGAAGYLNDFTINGQGSANIAVRDYILNLCTVGSVVQSGEPIRSAVCVKTYSVS